MKSKFSTSWNSSKQPRKQRKFKANAPLHKKHKFLSANLSESLRNKHAKRSLPLRKGDEVLIMRGQFKKKKAKVDSVNLIHSFVVLEGINRSKKDGTKIIVKFSPSNLQIVSLNLDDKKRMKVSNEQSQKTEEKPVSTSSSDKPIKKSTKKSKE